MGNRILKVVVDILVIETRALEPPYVGQTVSVPLGFRDHHWFDTTGPHVTTARVISHPHAGKHPRTGVAEQPIWDTRLRGDGWSASWAAERPTTGCTTITGTIYADINGHEDEVRGRITRVQTIRTRLRRAPTVQGWEPVPGTIQYSEVQEFPIQFESDHLSIDSDNVHRIIGVLIELDLEDVGSRPLRPPFLPSTTSVFGNSVWALDQELPILRRFSLDGANPAMEHIFPGPILDQSTSRFRRIHADRYGCWVVSKDEIFRTAFDESGSMHTSLISSTSIARSVSHPTTGSLLVIAPTLPGTRILPGVRKLESIQLLESPAAIYGIDGSLKSISVPAGIVQSALSGPSYFLILTRTQSLNRGVEFRLTKIHLDGRAESGPEFSFTESHPYPLLTSCNPTRIRVGNVFYRVGDDLSVSDSTQTPYDIARSGQAGEGPELAHLISA